MGKTNGCVKYSNYNVLTLFHNKQEYGIGDIYISKNSKDYKFNGLKILNIDYLDGVRLHFSLTEIFNK